MNTLEATIRNTNTKGEINSLRMSGNIPAIIYGGSEKNQKISLSKKNVKNLIEKENFLSNIIALNLDGKAENVLAPGRGINMGDGWETRRSRGKNFDWLIIKCGAAAKINKIQIDTHLFKGNYPDQCSIQASLIKGKPSAKKIVAISKKWKQLLNKVKLKAHKKHNFINKLMNKNKINYIRINIFPDGGISRIRLFGKVN